MLVSRATLRAAGYSDGELRQLLRTGQLTSVRPGSYLRGTPPPDAAVRHAVQARAALDQMADGAVCSHITAAVLHGLPVWRIPLDRVHVTRSGRRSGSRSNPRVHVHAASLRSDEISTAAGMPVTSLARTVCDLARTVPFEEAVAVLDAALHGREPTSRTDAPADRARSSRSGAPSPLTIACPTPTGPRQRRDPGRPPLDPAELTTALHRAAGWPGCPAARRAVAFADPAAPAWASHAVASPSARPVCPSRSCSGEWPLRTAS